MIDKTNRIRERSLIHLNKSPSETFYLLFFRIFLICTDVHGIILPGNFKTIL